MWPECNCIIIYMYSKRNVELRWFKMRQQNFVASENKLTKFFAFNMEQTVVENTIFHLSISLSIPEIYVIKV